MAKKSKDEQPLIKAEKEAEVHAQASREAQATEDAGQLVDEEQVEAEEREYGSKSEAAVAAEEAAVHTDNETARQASEITTVKKLPKINPTRSRGKKYLASRQKVSPGKLYQLKQAVKLAKETSYSSFDGSLELHVRLLAKTKGGTESIRGLIQLPHGTGKTTKAAILDEDLIEKIIREKQTEYDILIASKTIATKLPKIAKILGPQGKMPSIKAGTITDNPEETLAAIAGGRTEYKADSFGIIHQLVGKVSWQDQDILENITSLLGNLPQNRIASISIVATMGPAIKIDPRSI